MLRTLELQLELVRLQEEAFSKRILKESSRSQNWCVWSEHQLKESLQQRQGFLKKPQVKTCSKSDQFPTVQSNRKKKARWKQHTWNGNKRKTIPLFLLLLLRRRLRRLLLLLLLLSLWIKEEGKEREQRNRLNKTWLDISQRTGRCQRKAPRAKQKTIAKVFDNND